MSDVSSFAPVVGPNPRILILGSMPGIASLEAKQYYAHPRNAFWPIICSLLGGSPDMNYSQRLSLLKQHRVALWDVLKHCRRPGSLDSSIDLRTAQANDFVTLYRKHRSIRRVYFNGAAAADLYRRRVLADVQLTAPYLAHERLPSTSPANARITVEAKRRAWSVLIS